MSRAQDLFTTRGYAGTSLDAVVAAADVTKGALYHHYSGKRALFSAVFECTDAAAAARMKERIAAYADPWERASAGVRGFLSECREPTFRQVVAQDAPGVLGPDRLREWDSHSTYGVVYRTVQGVLQPHDVPGDAVTTCARVCYGAMAAVGLSASQDTEPRAANRRAETVIVTLLAGMRQLAAAGPAVTSAT